MLTVLIESDQGGIKRFEDGEQESDWGEEHRRQHRVAFPLVGGPKLRRVVQGRRRENVIVVWGGARRASAYEPAGHPHPTVGIAGQSKWVRSGGVIERDRREATCRRSARGELAWACGDVIGYYVHHHGSGHRTRFDAVAPLLGDVVAISEMEIESGLRLPSDVPHGCPIDPLAGGALHWAPLESGAARRLSALADWLAMRAPVGVVVDVSVEMAVACRLGGVPTVVVRQLGRRDDFAHELAFRTAQRLLAPWPRELEDDAVPAWIMDKTDHVGYIRSGSTCGRSSGNDPLDVRESDVVVLWGTGGGGLSQRVINGIAASCTGTVWCVGMGFVQGDTAGLADNVAVVGWRTDIDSILRNSPAVVASAGNNVIADAARWGCPLVLAPQYRPFGEQHAHAHRLAALGAAVVVDGDVAPESAWPGHLRAAQSCAGRLGELFRQGAAQRFADAVSDTFEGR